MNKSIIPIFLICDDNYSPYMATMIASICSNTKHHVSFHVIGKGISSDNQEKIAKMKEKFDNFEIDYRIFNATKIYNISHLALSRMTSSTFIRMTLPDLYPDIDKALIMDVDIISLQDIGKLWEQDLGDYIFAASLDLPFELCLKLPHSAYKIFKENMQVTDHCKYANCGVMIINCKKWRDEKISEKCLTIEKEYRDKLNCADQDVINKVFIGNFKQLDSNFNSLFGDENDIVNRHFCYLRKPWISKYNVEGDLVKNFDDWWKYAKMTPFYDDLYKEYCKYTNNKIETPESTIENYKKMEKIASIRSKMKQRGSNA